MLDVEATIRTELAQRGRSVSRVVLARHQSDDPRLELALVVCCHGEVPSYDLLDPLEIFDPVSLRDWISLRYGPRPAGVPASPTV